MQIAIAGLGVVGSALEMVLKKSKHVTRIYKHDPNLKLNDSFEKADYVFICVPAPTLENGKVDLSIIHDVLRDKVKKHVAVFIRTTVPPGTCDKLSAEYGLNIIAMPEFLTERQAFDDMLRLPIVVGLPKKGTDLHRDILFMFPGNKPVFVGANKNAELAKYAHNCLGAVKVNFFNVVYDVCEFMDADFDKVKEGMFASGHLSSTHSQVPGPDGKFGYGGKCYPKDMQAFSIFADSPMIDGCIKENFEFRSK